jgi:hypothetical protein
MTGRPRRLQLELESPGDEIAAMGGGVMDRPRSGAPAVASADAEAEGSALAVAVVGQRAPADGVAAGREPAGERRPQASLVARLREERFLIRSDPAGPEFFGSYDRWIGGMPRLRARMG